MDETLFFYVRECFNGPEPCPDIYFLVTIYGARMYVNVFFTYFKSFHVMNIKTLFWVK